MSDLNPANKIDVNERLHLLIHKYLDKFEEKLNEKDDIKIGDLLKMIELYRKVQPADSSHKQFWKMIDKIRKENEDKPKDINQKKKSKSDDS